MNAQVIKENVETIVGAYMNIEKPQGEGHSKEEIKQFMKMMGVEDAKASLELYQFEEHNKMQEDKGFEHAFNGFLWIMASLAFSACTFAIAAYNGGTYHTIWGMAVYGVIRLVYGLMMINTHKSAPQ